MANEDFKKIVIKDATLQWPKLDQTYRFNRSENRSEPAPNGAQGASWSCGFLMSAEDAKKLYHDLQTHYKECQSRNSKLPKFATVFGMRKNDDGTVVFSAKKNGMNGKGVANEAPTMLAGDLTPLADRRIWSGSTGNARIIAYPTQNPDGDGGISLLLDTIQVTKAIYGNDNLEDDFAPVAMKTEQVEAANDDPFGLPPVKQAAPSNAVFDDEIPF